MQMDDMIIVSVDDHIVEPADMFEGHVPDRWKDRAPRIIHGANGIDTWEFQGTHATSVGLNAVATWPKEEWDLDPVSFAEMRPGCYDVRARIDDMNAGGMLASINFPSMARFSGGFFGDGPDKDLGLAMLQAYNDWHIDEWCAAAPGRFIPLGILPLWDVDLAAAEVHRIGAKGARTVSFSEAPHTLGMPSIHSGAWDPVFAALCDENMVASIHIGSGSVLPQTAPDAPLDVMMVLACVELGVRTLTDFMWSGVLTRFPDLRIALSESGAGWVPNVLERFDRHYTNQRWRGWDFGGKLPSDIFREHFLTCSIVERTGLKQRHDIGIEVMALEVDYPHSDCTWPDVPEELWTEFTETGCTDAEINAITHENALRFFDYDAFAHVPRAQATVRALRAEAAHVDTATTSRAEYRRRWELAHA